MTAINAKKENEAIALQEVRGAARRVVELPIELGGRRVWSVAAGILR